MKDMSSARPMLGNNIKDRKVNIPIISLEVQGMKHTMKLALTERS